MKIYTKVGDSGRTRLYTGHEVAKNDRRVAAYGEVDELNSALGVVLASLDKGELREGLLSLQGELFELGADLATPFDSDKAVPRVRPAQVDALERWIDRATDGLPALKTFILPGGGPAGARLHLARAVCRRAERAAVALAAQEKINPDVLRYLNRLGDLLFTLARRVNHDHGVTETPWKPA